MNRRLDIESHLKLIGDVEGFLATAEYNIKNAYIRLNMLKDALNTETALWEYNNDCND